MPLPLPPSPEQIAAAKAEASRPPRERLVPSCTTLLEEGRWADVIALTAPEEATRHETRLLQFRAQAARVLGDQEVLADIVTRCASHGLPPHIRFAVVRELQVADRPLDAWAVLSGDEAALEDPMFLTLAGRLRGAISDRAIRHKMAEYAERLTKGGSRVHMAPVKDLHFPPGGAVPQAPGPCELVASPASAPRHIERLLADKAAFLKLLEKPRQPDLGEYRDVFLDRNGQVWDEEGRLIRRLHNARAPAVRGEVPEVETGLMLTGATKGIYHWLVDRVPHLAFATVPGTPPIPFLMTDNAPGFEVDAVDVAGFPPDRVVKVGDAVFVRRLLVARVGFAGMIYWDHVKPLIDRLTAEAERRAEEAGVELPRRIYISRRDAKRRSMLNEEALEAEMISRGITPVIFSDMPLWQQMAMVKRAELVVGPHGAGLSHLLLADTGTKVIEIMPIEDGAYVLRFNYARLCMLRGHDYAAWVQEAFPGPFQQWSVDIPGFLAFLDERL